MPYASSATLRRGASPRSAIRPASTTARPSPWPTNSSCGRFRPIVTAAWGMLYGTLGQQEPARSELLDRHRDVSRDGYDLLAAPGGGGAGTGRGAVMDFYAVLAQVHELLQRQGRVSYRALRLRFKLDDETLARSRTSSSTPNASRVTRKTGCSSDRAKQARPQSQSGRSSAARSRRIPLPPNPAPQRPSAASSRCCSVTWWTRPCWPASSTPRSGARWCGPIKRPAPR